MATDQASAGNAFATYTKSVFEGPGTIYPRGTRGAEVNALLRIGGPGTIHPRGTRGGTTSSVCHSSSSMGPC